ncbi:Uncharacterised protein [Anaerococcus prevotii]|uniref:Uncharacterized protein n=1 Tax=Anaerococcus prevotii (strain ATCC 9321 / DSM 20548 / JCM 6508 / NCTC 11806 / PC1) TaxID=525919 RepID=C7RDV9_ANAPD|nr:hypothetical protein [Anaerococcus prevotii]ACV29372.1 hypothetical protein Apre_1349 [Anaerococcus prevotii DSM 20548]SUU95044.1 Uncharacterised protein [Anaerococcus prevotii]
MKMIKVLTSGNLSYAYNKSSDLKKKLEKDRKEEHLNEVKFLVANDRDYEKLMLFVILSPIFIACFDSSSQELDFFRRRISNSNFPYGLYPEFFPFEEEKYRNFYMNKENKEDIFLNEEGLIEFTINPIGDKYILALAYLLEKLIEDDKNRKKLLTYFAEIRNDIVINGRRSILANGIQAFYLSKYVVVRMIEIIDKLMAEEKNDNIYLKAIYDRLENLKRCDF